MVKTAPVADLIHVGAKLLHELDVQNFPVESMFWIHLAEQGYWRLVIASPTVAEQGTAQGYGLLNELQRKLGLVGKVFLEISLLDPQYRQFQSFLALARESHYMLAGPEWIEGEDAVVYRWTGESATAKLSCDISSTELNQIWEAERELSGDPALLISSEHGLVRLRFHPKHGRLTSIANIKTAFATALHRARPDCQITWVNG
jgi:hypothetical protein